MSRAAMEWHITIARVCRRLRFKIQLFANVKTLSGLREKSLLTLELHGGIQTILKKFRKDSCSCSCGRRAP
jgi:hypothetical protein